MLCAKDNYHISLPDGWQAIGCAGSTGAKAAHDLASVGVVVLDKTYPVERLETELMHYFGASTERVHSGTLMIGGIRFHTEQALVHISKGDHTAAILFADAVYATPRFPYHVRDALR